MNKSLFIIFLFLSGGIYILFAQDTIPPVNEMKTKNVFEILRTPDTLNNVTVNIYQDKRIEQLFQDRIVLNNAGAVKGHRVQVFSSNVQKTAKSEAFRIERLIRERFPERGVYVTYDSPSWKVRVGDFRTREEAQVFQRELTHAFPDMKKAMYVVKDDILVSGSK